MNVTVQQAYQEACTALGEAEVRNRFQAAEIARLTGEVEALRRALLEDSPADPDATSTPTDGRPAHV